MLHLENANLSTSPLVESLSTDGISRALVSSTLRVVENLLDCSTTRPIERSLQFIPLVCYWKTVLVKSMCFLIGPFILDQLFSKIEDGFGSQRSRTLRLSFCKAQRTTWRRSHTLPRGRVPWCDSLAYMTCGINCNSEIWCLYSKHTRKCRIHICI